LLGPPLAPLQQLQVCPVLGASELEAGFPGGLIRAEQRGRSIFFDMRGSRLWSPMNESDTYLD